MNRAQLLTPLMQRVFHERWKGLIGWASGLIALIAIQVSVYPTIRDSRADWADVTEQFPEAFRKIFRMEDYTSPTGYLSTELFSFMIPLIFIGLATTWASRSAADEEENGTADILLTLPVARSSILMTRLFTTVCVVFSLIGVSIGALVIGTELTDMNVGYANIVQACVSCGLLSFTFAGVSVVLASITGRRGVGLGAGIGIAIAAFVLYSLAPLVAFLENLLPINPFQWTIGQSPLVHGLDVWRAALAISFSGLLGTVAVYFYDRRDIAG